jgi:hypothetical protein
VLRHIANPPRVIDVPIYHHQCPQPPFPIIEENDTGSPNPSLLVEEAEEAISRENASLSGQHQLSYYYYIDMLGVYDCLFIVYDFVLSCLYLR